MTPTEIRNIFEAQVENVRELERAWKHVKRDINRALISSNEVASRIETKLLALIYCALAEALFSKLIHNHHSFTSDEIGQIKSALSSGGVKDAWNRCIELCLRKIPASKSNHPHNVRQKLTAIIDEHIHEPSLLRNKIAHGQWSLALNRDNTKQNPDITNEIQKLSVVELERRKDALIMLNVIVKDLVESPTKAHHRDYWSYLCKLECEQKSKAIWTIQERITRLKHKKSFAPPGV